MELLYVYGIIYVETRSTSTNLFAYFRSLGKRCKIVVAKGRNRKGAFMNNVFFIFF